MRSRRFALLAAASVFALAGGTVAVGAAPASADSSAASVTLTVAKSGAEYTTVQAAVNAVPDNSGTAYTISIAAGTYSEMVSIPATKLHLSLIGATGNAKDVVITSSTYAGETT